MIAINQRSKYPVLPRPMKEATVFNKHHRLTLLNYVPPNAIRILEVLDAQCGDRDYCDDLTVKQIAERVGIHWVTVFKLLRRLEAAGRLNVENRFDERGGTITNRYSRC